LRTGAAIAPEDVQATLTLLTASTIADAIVAHAPTAQQVYVCGGGAENALLMRLLQQQLDGRATVQSTAALGVAAQHVEALAFAWLAR
ncbi:anhydro-N-acetylmuramic acid kinase, partial [Escherichia coli]|uniref:anhydro-N-acetylmuramic acid kinase n=2 Tax=Pseudomonadota TaxID=1224 RepID=UPI003CE55D96